MLAADTHENHALIIIINNLIRSLISLSLNAAANPFAQWLCKLDENGRLYFYEENGTESAWELPDLSAPADEAGNQTAAADDAITTATSSVSVL